MSSASIGDAVRLQRAGDYDGAVIALEGVLARQPSNPAVLARLAEVQLRRGRLEEAGGALDRAEAAGGATARTTRLRGDLHYRAGRYPAAARAYEESAALGNDDTWSLVQLARCRLRLGDTEGASGAAARALEREPSSSAAYVVLGDVASRDQRLAEAEAQYRRAHECNPRDDWAYARLVEARLLQLPDDRRAAEIRVLMKTTGRENTHLVGVLARMHTEGGDAGAAAEAWGSRAKKGDLFARKQEGFALKRAGRLDEAAAVLGPCLGEDPEDRYVFSSYVSLQRQRGAVDELRRVLEDALPRAGSRRGAYYGTLRKLPAPAEAEAEAPAEAGTEGPEPAE